MGQVYLFGQCLVSGIQGDVDSFLNACRMLHIFGQLMLSFHVRCFTAIRSGCFSVLVRLQVITLSRLCGAVRILGPSSS